ASAGSGDLPAGGPYATFFVAVHNEERIIERCILSLVNQTYRNCRVVFVNDASTDGTAAVLDRYAERGLIRVIHLARNVGKKKALAAAMLGDPGEVFVFTDSDSVVAPDAVEKLMTVFASDPDVGAVSGHCRALNADANLLTRVQDSWYEGQFSIKKAFESIFGAVTCVSGPLAAFRREAVYNFIPAWTEDTFLGREFRFATDRTLTGFVLGSRFVGRKLKRRYAGSPFVEEVDYPARDWKIVYCKAARAWTHVPDTFGRFLHQQVRWKKSFVRNLFFTGRFYWRKPLCAAVNYYLHALFVVAGPFVAFRHLVYLPLNGNYVSGLLYFLGIAYIGFLFGLAFRIENRGSRRWLLRPVMSLMSTLCLSWLIFYSLATIRRSVWRRG
ncbi:MAG: glycosyltransferase family 2 protein, partial [Acidobacteria bacterium]|nr:glycosyltransferase family 2 protein [Acidobacteriota bacterium]